MRKWLIVLSLLLTGANAATVWTWVDETGQVHYSDTPVPGARQIEITSSSRLTTVPAFPVPASPAVTENGAEQSSAAPMVRVVRPADQETLWNIGGVLEVQLALERPLRANQWIDVLLDGQRQNVNTTGTQFTLPDVYRGTHTLVALIVDAAGREISRSEPVTFTVQQTSIQNPNNPNVPRRP